jgi:DNA-binding CsgD family transcriptional regulator
MHDAGHELLPVGLAIADAGLRRALLQALRGHPALVVGEDEPVRVLITDQAGGEAGVPTLHVGGGALSGAAFATRDDPDLILSAAHLMAAGYRIAAGPAGVARQARGQAGAPVHLTPRERQVLDMVVAGASNKHIANALAISVHTAKFHVTALLEKLGARNRSDLVGIALREGHVTL